jgi:hypothetical protein
MSDFATWMDRQERGGSRRWAVDREEERDPFTAAKEARELNDAREADGEYDEQDDWADEPEEE